MTPDEAERRATSGELLPVYLVVGQERHLAEQLVKALKERVTSGGVEGLNDDSLMAAQCPPEQALAIARTLPMLAQKRWLLVRGIEKWEEGKTSKGARQDGIEALANYLQSPGDSCVMVLTASKLDKRKRLYTTAKKAGFLVECETPKRAELPGWIMDRIRSRGNSASRTVAELIAELSGDDLSTLADAVERVCLYVGDGQQVTEDAVSTCVVRLRTKTVWELVGAVGRRDAQSALRALEDVFDPSDRGLRLLGVLSWATRQLVRFHSARQRGLSPPEAAKAAGAPPFKAKELEQQVRGLSSAVLEKWIESLAAADLALKGASARPPRAIVERMILDLCASA